MPFFVRLLDYYGSEVLTESTSTVAVGPIGVFRGSVIVRVVNGTAMFADAELLLSPGHNTSVVFTTATDLDAGVSLCVLVTSYYCTLYVDT